MYFDYMDEQISDKRLKELECGEETTIPAKDVFKELGI